MRSFVIGVLVLSFFSLYAQVTNGTIVESSELVIGYDEDRGSATVLEVKKFRGNSFQNNIDFEGKSVSITETGHNMRWPQRNLFHPEENPDTLIIPEGIERINSYFLKGNRIVNGDSYGKLRSIVLPNSLKIIEENAFNTMGARDYQFQFESFRIPSSVEEIGEYAFYCTRIKNLDLGRTVYIGRNAFDQNDSLRWVVIPRETKIIGLNAFKCKNLFFVQLSSKELNPVIDFYQTFGGREIAWIGCPSEFLSADIGAKYQTDMPEVFAGRAMINLKSSPVPVFFSFEEIKDKEFLWVPDIDLWGLQERDGSKDEITTDENGMLPFQSPVRVRLDVSGLTEYQKDTLKVFYNDEDITTQLLHSTFVLSDGRPFNYYGWQSGETPILNRLKITI